MADVRRHRVVRLPNAFVFDHPRGALLFATDRGNEVNSDTEESTGQIRFGRVRCGRRLRVSFRVRGSLGSELSDGATVAVRDFRGVEGRVLARLGPAGARVLALGRRQLRLGAEVDRDLRQRLGARPDARREAGERGGAERGRVGAGGAADA